MENWRILRRLIGHENDVQDVGWSPDSSILVSVGLDSRVVVWSGFTFEKLKTLSIHSSHVKGITFDPANKYFATASDDRSIKVFRYTPIQSNTTPQDSATNFMLEATITEPFQTSPLTTYFRRCSWSPEGTHIAAANATNGPVSTAAIVNRGTWDSEINLVGHEGPLEVCAFSPRLFTQTAQEANDMSGHGSTSTVIACAGQDRALSIWNTMSSKPLLVNEGLCMKSISDLAWAPDGERLFYTSLDGTIALAHFGPGELGFPVSQELTDQTLAKFGAGRKMGVIEGPDGLLLEELSKSDELKNVQGRMGELMGDAHTAGLTAINSTPNGVQANGKASDKEVNGLTNGHRDTGETSQAQAEDPKVERLRQRVTITKDGKKRVTPLLVSSTGTAESTLPAAQLRTLAAQNKDDAPQSILDLSKPYDGLPKGGLASLLFGNKRRLAETGTEDDNNIRQKTESTARQGSTSILLNTSDGLTLPSKSLTLLGDDNRPSVIDPALSVSQIRLAVPLVRSHLTRPINGQTLQAEGAESNGLTSSPTEEHCFEVRNAVGPSRTGRTSDRDPSRITVSKKGQILWQDYLPKSVLLVTGNPRFWAAACEDGSLHIWTPGGRRLLNAFTMEAQPVILDSRGPYLLAITSVGICHVWNIISSSSPHPPVSLAPILDVAAHSQGPHVSGGPSVVFARLNSQGRVIVALSNGDAFTYSPMMYVWQRLSEAWWAVGSQYWNTNESQTSTQTSTSRAHDPEDDDEVRLENISAGIIPLLERNTTSYTLLRGRAYFLQKLIKTLLSAEGYEGFESAVSVAHLENRLAGALTLGAKDEFKMYLGMYAKRLGAESSRLKIEELLRSLMAGVFHEEGDQTSTAADDGVGMGGTSDELCGWKKEVLLKEVVLILGMSFHSKTAHDMEANISKGKYRDLQRVTVPYARILGITGDSKLSGGSENHDMEVE